ncbi:hypothetical protein RD110_09720 [Rhodoferax koreense]|uniref:Twin-arginine translocation pathway signal protein n=1 Tax=Rhodoferax koreensis TaxID=1842727 RepID=A0A1P8JUK5_9BURK|nr:tripartite tricarboxylate transporter substrate binding protein [Rhodoferax koreense]APW37432.1 hypothetical protein RD110_09720 [Rhodoferax koreense]
MPLPTNRRRFLGTTASLACAGLGGLRGAQAAEAYPAQMITYFVPYAAGGLSDQVARMLGDGVMRATGKNMLVDYKLGAGGSISVDTLLRAPADGYTVLGATNGFFGVIPFINKVKYDPLADLVPAALLGDAFLPLVVSPRVPVKSFAELVTYAKAHPGKLNFGSGGIGSGNHLSGEYLKRRLGIDIVHVPYKGGTAALQAALAGDIDMIFGPESADSVLAGKLKAVAVMGTQRWSKLPDVPTSEELGLKNWELRSWHTVVVSSKTPPDVVAQINGLVNRIMSAPEMAARLRAAGLEPSPLSVAALADRARADHKAFGQLIRDLGITAT